MHKVSTHSANSDIFLFLSVFWLSLNFVKFHEIIFKTDVENEDFQQGLLYLTENGDSIPVSFLWNRWPLSFMNDNKLIRNYTFLLVAESQFSS